MVLLLILAGMVVGLLLLAAGADLRARRRGDGRRASPEFWRQVRRVRVERRRAVRDEAIRRRLGVERDPYGRRRR